MSDPQPLVYGSASRMPKPWTEFDPHDDGPPVWERPRVTVPTTVQGDCRWKMCPNACEIQPCESRTRPAPWAVMLVGDPYLDYEGNPQTLMGWQLDGLPYSIVTFGADEMAKHFTLDLDRIGSNPTRTATGLMP